MSIKGYETGHGRAVEDLPRDGDACGLRPRVVLVQAPAGYEKTSLLVHWMVELERRGVRCGWVTLDEDDNQASRRLLHLAAALLAGRRTVTPVSRAWSPSSSSRPAGSRACSTSSRRRTARPSSSSTRSST